jgi:hypothetical protein
MIKALLRAAGFCAGPVAVGVTVWVTVCPSDASSDKRLVTSAASASIVDCAPESLETPGAGFSAQNWIYGTRLLTSVALVLFKLFAAIQSEHTLYSSRKVPFWTQRPASRPTLCASLYAASGMGVSYIIAARNYGGSYCTR